MSLSVPDRCGCLLKKLDNYIRLHQTARENRAPVLLCSGRSYPRKALASSSNRYTKLGNGIWMPQTIDVVRQLARALLCHSPADRVKQLDQDASGGWRKMRSFVSGAEQRVAPSNE
ncbi:unnamed protein product [Caenorhabditis brenneri]